MLAWAFFFVYRKFVENGVWDTSFLDDVNFYKGILVIPVGWILIYAIFDNYRDLYRMSIHGKLSRISDASCNEPEEMGADASEPHEGRVDHRTKWHVQSIHPSQ